MNLALHLKCVGLSMIVLAIAHVYFARYFEWKKDLASLTPLNRQIFQVHCFFICLILVLFGVLSLVYTNTLLQPTPLAKVVLAGLLIFWATRLFMQFFVYDSKHWRGNRLHTVAHLGFSFLWIYYVTIYAIAFWRQ